MGVAKGLTVSLEVATGDSAGGFVGTEETVAAVSEACSSDISGAGAAIGGTDGDTDDGAEVPAVVSRRGIGMGTGVVD